MSGDLPTPVTETHVYLAAILIQLQKIANSLDGVTNELQRLNAAAIQKPNIQVQLDTARLAEAIDNARTKPTGRNQPKR